MTVEDVNFLDLVVLLKITPNMVLEKIGGMINASIFDASNLAGGLKQKGLIDFTATFPGPTTIQLTDAGKMLLTEADVKATEPFDKLDESILMQLSGGKRIPADLGSTLNLRSKDLALRLYKLDKQGFTTYEAKNGAVFIMLTEQGFLRAKVEQKVTVPAGQMPTTQQIGGQAVPQAISEHGQQGMPIQKKGGIGKTTLIVLVIVILIGVLLYVLNSQGYITI